MSTVKRFISSYVQDHPDEFPEFVEIEPKLQNNIENDDEFKNYILNALKQLKSKMKTLTIVVAHSNNYTGYSVLSGKSEAIESGYGFMGIVGYKVIFKW
jgi:hypothetical protein